MFRKLAIVLIVAVIAVGLWPAENAAQGAALKAANTFTLPISVLGQFGGGATKVEVVGTRAYVAIGSRVLVLDITNPAAPGLLGLSAALPSTISDLDVEGTTVYVADGVSGLRVLDASNPAAITEIGSRAVTYYAVEVIGSTAYMGVGSDLKVLDVSNPASITQIGQTSWSGNVSDFAVYSASGSTYLVVTRGTSGIQLVDVTTPSTPTLSGSYDTPSIAAGVVVYSDFAVVADTGGLVAVNLSTPSTPTLAGAFSGLNRAADVTLNTAGPEIYAYVTSDTGFTVLDITDFGAISSVGAFTEGGYDFQNAAVTLVGGHLLLAAGEAGLLSVDVSTPATPTLAGTVGPLDRMQDGVMVNPTTLVVANGISGFEVYDVSNPSTPVSVTEVDTVWDVRQVAVFDHYLVVVEYGNVSALRVYDMMDPANPAEVDSATLPGRPVDMAANGELVVVTGQNGNFWVYDVSDPNAISVPVSVTLSAGTTTGLDLVGTRLYVTTLGGGLYIYDVSVPSTPALLGSYPSANIGYTVIVIGSLAVTAPNSTGLVIDVSDPTMPVEVGSFVKADWSPSCGNITQVEMRGPVAVVNCAQRLALVDLSDPLNPVSISQQATRSSFTDGLVVNNNVVFALEGTTGMEVMTFTLYQVMLPVVIR